MLFDKETKVVETLEQFRQRTSFVYQPFSEGPVSINPNCLKKVNERGEFCQFYGDTLVYLLDDKVKDHCRYYQDQLYQYCEDVFAEPLNEEILAKKQAVMADRELLGQLPFPSAMSASVEAGKKIL